MAGWAGRDVAFTWKGQEIEGIREKGIAASGAAIDVTSDDDAGWQALLEVAGQNAVTLTISGVTKNHILAQAWFSGARTGAAELTYPSGATISATFYLQDYTDTGPYNDAMTFDATLMSSGPVTFTPPTGS